MKLNLILLAICSCLAMASCKEKPAPPTDATHSTDPISTPNKEISYLPVGDLIREDIRRVDSFAAGILHKKESARKDSSYIQLPAFKKMAEQFLLPEIDSSKFQQLFGYESFMDETTEMIHFIYPAKDTSTALRKVVVYIRPSLNVDKVNRIYMEKEFRDGNDFVQQKLTWVIDKYFYILTIRHPQTGAPLTSIEKVIWDPQSYAY